VFEKVGAGGLGIAVRLSTERVQNGFAQFAAFLFQGSFE
jgi:hypothetical protein